MFFWNSLAFSLIQRMLAIWSLVPLPFLNPAWASGSSRLTVRGIAEAWLGEFWALLYQSKRWVQLCNSLSILWHCFGIGMKTDLFQSWGHCWVFQICWHIECSTFRASSFRVWNSSTVILSPPLALFVTSKPSKTPSSFLSSKNKFKWEFCIWIENILLVWDVRERETVNARGKKPVGLGTSYRMWVNHLQSWLTQSTCRWEASHPWARHRAS